jgi:hypothetical protein
MSIDRICDLLGKMKLLYERAVAWAGTLSRER